MRRKKRPQNRYEYESFEVSASIPEHTLYPPLVKIGKTTLEFHILPTSQEMTKLDEQDRIKVLGLVVTPAAQNTLNRFIGAREWLSGVIMVASLLEFVGKTRLLWKFEKTISKTKILNMDLEEVTTFLFATEIIDQAAYATMHQIRRGRNEIVHHPNIAYDLMFQKSKAVEKAKNIIKKTQKCLDILAPRIEGNTFQNSARSL